MSAPTLVAEYEAPWGTNTSPKTVSATAASGDVFIVAGGSENGGTLVQTPTGGTGITWTLQETQGTNGNMAHCILFSASPSAQSWTLSAARNATVNLWGFDALRFSGSDGVGAAESGNNGTGSGAPTLGITTTQDNSALVVVVANWNAGAAEPTFVAVNGYTPTVANGGTVAFFGNASNYTIAVAVYPDVGAAGAKTVGQSAPSNQRYVIAAIEVKGTVSSTTIAADPATLTLQGQTPTLSGSGSASITADVASLNLQGQTPAIAGSGSASIPVDQAALTLQGQTPVLAGTGNVNIPVDTAILNLQGQTPSLGGGIVIPVDTAILNLQGQTPALSAGPGPIPYVFGVEFEVTWEGSSL